MIIAFQSPPDGYEKYEQIFLRDMIVDMYHNIPDNRDRFIMMAHFELNYTEDEIGRILEVSQPYINKKIKEIQEELRNLRKQNK